MPDWKIIGHDWAVRLLGAQIAAGRTRHAYLFAGMAGVGKTTLATHLAQAFNCSGNTSPCGTCRSCDLIERGIHPDILVIDSGESSIKIEQIRDMTAMLTLHPLEAPYKIAMILNAHQMTPAAADALLKTLEEPPATAKLILTAENIEAMPLTIPSRCQVLTLRPVSISRIETALGKLFDLPSEQAAQLACLSRGRPGWAIRAAQETTGEKSSSPLQDQRLEMLTALIGILQTNRAGRFAYSENTATHTDTLSLLLDTWMAWWRDVLLIAEESQLKPVNIDQIDILTEVARKVGREKAQQALRTIYQTTKLLAETNVNARLALDVMLLQLPYL
jgi:DNA polymerase-3 subunit delta'